MLNQALWYRSFGQPEEVLSLETRALETLQPGLIRVRMAAAPINPSDLIPVTGAYGHRVVPPLVAGYEGVGRVVEVRGSAPHWAGRRVLPLRRGGTWQDYVDCDPAWAIAVPDDIDDDLACRAYINPLAALLMLRRWNPAGKRVLVTAAGSTCAGLLAQWALASGAVEVAGVHRAPSHAPRLRRFGIEPLATDRGRDIALRAGAADIVFDAVGGALAGHILAAMREDAVFVSYGLLSGEAFALADRGPKLARFHIRDGLEGLPASTWQAWFEDIWQRLPGSVLPPVRRFALQHWRQALADFHRSGRYDKPILSFGRDD